MFIGPAEDRQAIRERVDAYSDAVFRHDAEAWIDCWAREAVWRLPGLEVAGRDKIKATWVGAMGAYALAGFFANPGSIVVEGDKAKATNYTQEILILAAGGVRKVIGSYADNLVKEDGVWRFASRSYTVLHDEKG
jgi:uncharacterized protein (TIGR02246 family)